MVPSNTIKGNQTPLSTSGKVGDDTESSSKVDIQHLTTLGDGGLQFQPTPESGQAFSPAPRDLTSSPYVREEKIPLYVWNQKEYCKDHRACHKVGYQIFLNVVFLW